MIPQKGINARTFCSETITCFEWGGQKWTLIPKMKSSEVQAFKHAV